MHSHEAKKQAIHWGSQGQGKWSQQWEVYAKHLAAKEAQAMKEANPKKYRFMRVNRSYGKVKRPSNDGRDMAPIEKTRNPMFQNIRI